jgi:hypothetical protein
MTEHTRTKEKLARIAAKTFFAALMRYDLLESDETQHYWVVALEEIAKENGYELFRCVDCNRLYFDKIGERH